VRQRVTESSQERAYHRQDQVSLQGSMLRSQLSAIFDHFRRKLGVFPKNQYCDQIFAKFSFA
jgi:hypothetical protein